jgi:hypothetical protein
LEDILVGHVEQFEKVNPRDIYLRSFSGCRSVFGFLERVHLRETSGDSQPRIK